MKEAQQPFVHVKLTWDLWEWMEKGPLRMTGGNGKATYLRNLVIKAKTESEREVKKEAIQNG